MTNYQVTWHGPVRSPTGIGIASRQYALALRRQGVNVRVKASRSRLFTQGQTQAKTRVLIFHRTPHTLNFTKARKQYDHILLNTVWETTKIPRKWAPHMNKYDAVCVPSVQNKTAMRNSGVKVPVYIVPHGVNTRDFTPSNPKLSLPILEGTFKFVSVFTFQHRKNPETLLRAYWEEFSAKDKVALVIKTSGFGSEESDRWIRSRIEAYKNKLGIRHATAPIYIITGHTSSRKLKGIYTLGNAFVLPTRGEGVGLPFLEALASGVPVIATGWGGHMDFLNARNSFLVSYKLRPPGARMKGSISRSFSELFAQKGQLWAEPELASLKKQMRHAYANPRLCRQKGLQGRKDMQSWSWNRAGIAMKHAVEQVIRSGKSHQHLRRKGEGR